MGWMIDPTDWYPTVGVASDGPTPTRRVVIRNPEPVQPMRCPSLYPAGTLLSGQPIRCEERIGHSGSHGHSFAARYWDDER